MTKLSVNLNKIALLRNARGANYPKVLDFADFCIKSGAHGITIHPRPDQRHATYQDVVDLAEFRNRNPGIELNIEGYPSRDFLDVVISSKPDQCTLVPDAPDQITSDHGWNTPNDCDVLRPIIAELKDAGIRTSIFLDPEPELIESACETGTDRIELYTESYAKAFGTNRQSEVLEEYRATALSAQESGLGVNAGHDLNQKNLSLFLTIPGILEISIGHALTVEALLDGYRSTVGSYVQILNSH